MVRVAAIAMMVLLLCCLGDDIDWEGPVGEALAELLLPSASHINFSIG